MPDTAYSDALRAECAAVSAFMAACHGYGAAHGYKMLGMLKQRGLHLAGWPARQGEDPEDGAEHSNRVARLFRNALLIHDLERIANQVAVLEAKKR